MHISEINVYPIKSLKGISLDSAVVERRGLQYDRRWMLATPDGMFLTQREFPTMATITVEVVNDELRAMSDGFGSLLIPVEPDKGERRAVTIWQSVCDGLVYDTAVNDWFSDVLGTECQLVYMPDDSRRNVNKMFNSGEDIVSFADGYPLLVIGEASLDDLNARIQESETRAATRPEFRPLPMKRFRPNIVVSGSAAFAEDDWKRIRVGDCVFRVVKPCARCVITTVDPAKGEFDGKEPLKTLASYRMARDVMPGRYEEFGHGPTAVLFGQNLIPEGALSPIRVGDEVVLS
ncbi:MAG: MOSC domain-containing protein [Pyrinomonadaceae bacterium]